MYPRDSRSSRRDCSIGRRERGRRTGAGARGGGGGGGGARSEGREQAAGGGEHAPGPVLANVRAARTDAEVGVDGGVPRRPGKVFVLAVGDVLPRARIAVLFGQAKVDQVHDAPCHQRTRSSGSGTVSGVFRRGREGLRACGNAPTSLAVAHQKVVRLDVAVDKVFRVQKLDAGNLRGVRSGNASVSRGERACPRPGISPSLRAGQRAAGRS